MTVIPNDNCARCKHFEMKKYPDHARVGLGRCGGYDNAQPLINPFVPWSSKPCARFFRAADVVVRQEWIERQQAKKRRTSSAEPDETVSRASIDNQKEKA
jgi:hypothetical protein